jgi:chaperonin cofactor prefoldin
MASVKNSAEKEDKMGIKRIVAIALLFILLGCAQVPKESVELSTTVGRDIAEVYRAHRELAIILYTRIKSDINKFIDEVYAPYVIKELLAKDQARFNQGNQLSLFFALNSAVQQPDNKNAQLKALDFMDIFVRKLRARIESYRAELLQPVMDQEKRLLSAIDRSYNQIHYANSIVTGHLASIVKVHDAQEEILQKFGVEGLRKDVGENLAEVSNKVASLVETGKKAEEEIEKTTESAQGKSKKLQEKFNEIKNQIEDLFNKIGNKEENNDEQT